MCDETAGHVTNAGADDKIDKSDITERIKNARGWVVDLAVWVCARASRNSAAGQTYERTKKNKAVAAWSRPPDRRAVKDAVRRRRQSR